LVLGGASGYLLDGVPADDGILLRRDLHMLYDRGLLTISSDGHVALDTRVQGYYAEFDGAKLGGA